MSPLFKSRAIRSSAVAAMLVGSAFSASVATAASFQLRVPVMGLVATPTARAEQAVTEILVALTGGPALPAAEVNFPYSYSLSQLLSVSGDASYKPADVSWSILSGGLPAGLSLSADGVISGRPTTKNTTGSSFEVTAAYKTKTGQQAYTIVVNGAVLHVTQIATGNLYTCAVTTAGGVKCWGINNNAMYGVTGLLGDGTTTAARLTPVDVVGLTSGVAQIATGYLHTCARTSTGTVKCWGNNGSSQLGDGTTTQQNLPVSVTGLTGAVSIAAGYGHTCAVISGGSVKCWGRNVEGELGDGTTTARTTPVSVSNLTPGAVSVTAGYFHTCAVTTGGGAKCWGGNGNAQLGDDSVTNRNTPVDVSGLTEGVVSLSAGYSHTCAVTTGGGAKCWGYNGYGGLGDNSTSKRLTPVDVFGLTTGTASISAGMGNSCAVTTSGAATCWGNNSSGQLGDGTTTNRKTPVAVSGLTNGVTSISNATGGGYHTCAITTTGPKCWGANDQGQLGDGTFTPRTTPVVVNP